MQEGEPHSIFVPDCVPIFTAYKLSYKPICYVIVLCSISTGKVLYWTLWVELSTNPNHVFAH